jgi:PAS domain S-box-containing protein
MGTAQKLEHAVTRLAEPLEASSNLQTFLDDRIVDLPDRLFELLPVGVYVCDRAGLIVRYNRAAAELWGCSPKVGDPALRYCGSYRLYGLNGTPVPHSKCPMADVLASGKGLRDQEIVIEQPDGTRIVALVNIDSIKDGEGRILGAVNVFRRKPEQSSHQPRRNGSVGNAERILQGLPTAVYTTDADGRITFYNEAAAELWGVRPELGKSEFCGSWKLYWPDGTPLPHDECPMALALKEKRPIRGMEAIAERPDGTRVPFIPYPTPLFDASGVLIGGVNTLVDISERHQAEQRIRDSEARYRAIAAIVESSDDAILVKNLDAIITSWNQGAQRLFGYTAEEAIGQPITILIPDELRHEELTIIGRIRRGEPTEHYETVRRRKDGSLVDISLTVSPVKNSEGVIIAASKIARNITGRKQAEERQRLLLREMDHRVKNLFAVASGVVALSARSAKTPREMSAAVQDRLAALAQAHSLTLPKITEDGRRSEAPTTLHALIQTILLPYHGGEGEEARVNITGPDMPIPNGALTSFALLLHEFATNAAKYGALAVPTGSIDIRCSEDDRQFALTWTERGEPLVKRETHVEGFGTLLTRATVKQQLGGEISHDWSPEGLSIRLTVAKSSAPKG